MDFTMKLQMSLFSSSPLLKLSEIELASRARPEFRQSRYSGQTFAYISVPAVLKKKLPEI